jgi:hypothetical protein
LGDFFSRAREYHQVRKSRQLRGVEGIAPAVFGSGENMLWTDDGL